MAPSFGWGRSLSGSFPKNFAKLNDSIDRETMAKIKVGYSLFAKPWVQAPSSTKRRDGLGPHFNATSCISCHQGMGRSENSLLFKSASKELLEKFGPQISPKALPHLKEEAILALKTPPIIGRKVLYTFEGEVQKVSPRIAPHVAGLGFLEKISDHEIRKNLSNGGTLSIVRKQLGRFGWKADQENLVAMVAGAFSNDMGITSFLYPNEQCTDFDEECLHSQNGADEEGVEIKRDHLLMVVNLIRNIEPPKPLVENIRDLKGHRIFKKINCQSCHRIQYEVDGKDIFPYTDLLLHDMGEALSDNSDLPNRSLFRTAPLWGLGSQVIVNGHNRYLHDGRAKSLEEAILWHGGEAENSRENYEKLSNEERQELIQFLSKL